MIEAVLRLLFGGGRNTVKETAEVFRENAEAAALRDFGLRGEALEQFAREFASPTTGVFDRVMDGINRLPRPALALGTLALFAAAMIDPIWFAARMQGIALVPEPLWWLLGVIVSFYFGARHQMKGQAFQRSIAATMLHAASVTRNIEALQELGREGADQPEDGAPSAAPGANAALEEWRAGA